MRARASAWLGLMAWPLLLLAPTAVRADGFESAVLAEINAVRANPRAYARELRRQQVLEARYRDDGYGMSLEDPDAVDEAIDFLMRQPPAPPLAHDRRLAEAARRHVARQGPRGDVGHGGSGALNQRLQAQGVFAGISAESISYGQAEPRDVVRQLVVDSRVPGRGHRRDLFSHAYQAAGVACGAHRRWGDMCVIDYAGAVMRRGGD
jgi:uncharacterized protein YkwD